MRQPKKNYLASLVVTFTWWFLLLGIVVLVDPAWMSDFLLPGGYLVFFLVLFLAVFFTMSLILMSSRRGLLAAIGVVILGYMQLWRINNWLNAILLAGILILTELYFWGKSDTNATNSSLND